MDNKIKVEKGRYLITGGTGSLGVALVEFLLDHGVKAIRIFSRDEKKQNDMMKRFPHLDYMLGDVRDYNRCVEAVSGVDYVIHGASLKYVHLGEVHPSEFVKTNVVGTLNIIEAIKQVGSVKKVIGISSDKACRPFNAYGMTKGILEKLFIEAERKKRDLQTAFKVVRYGNVLATRGSVILLWYDLYRSGHSLKVTNPRMTRFFFSLEEAIKLIFWTLVQERNDIIVSRKMPAVVLKDLVYVMSHGKLDRVTLIGHRPGEKIDEELISENEVPFTVEVGDKFVIYPGEMQKNHIGLSYGSDVARVLSEDEIIAYLVAEGCYDEE